MKSKKFIEKACQTILKRVKFHAPVLFDGFVDKRILFENGIDVNAPIFKFDKPLTKPLLRAFELAQKEEKFNLVLSIDAIKKVKPKSLERLRNLTIFDPKTSSSRLFEMINKLNINYPAKSEYNLQFKERFSKFNGQILNPNFKPFGLFQSEVIDNFFLDYHEFVLSGTNFFVKVKNFSNEQNRATFELNLPLKKGYYFFKKRDKLVEIQNLLTKEKFSFNFLCKNAKFSFSCIDGLENSVFCCVNVKVSFNLKPKEEKTLFFNFGDCKSRVESLGVAEKLLKLANTKCCEIFDVQVKTKNHDFDQYFNFILPKRIWINWLNNSVDEKLEEKYLTLKRLFVKGGDKLAFVKFNEIGLKELGVFNGEYYKKILFVKSCQKFVKIGRTEFLNLCEINKNLLKSKDAIMVSTGD